MSYWILDDTVSLNSPFTLLAGAPRELTIVDTSVINLRPSVNKIFLQVNDVTVVNLTITQSNKKNIPLTINDITVVDLTISSPSIINDPPVGTSRFPVGNYISLVGGTYSSLRQYINIPATIVDQTIVNLLINVYVPPEDLTNLALDTFISGIPDSLNFDQNIQAIGLALDNRLLQVLPLIDQVRVLCNIDNQNEVTLDWIAFQMGVDFYYIANRQTVPQTRIALKKTLIKNAFYIQKKKGTPFLIQQVLTWLFPDLGLILQEWFQYNGVGGHFRLWSPNGIIESVVTLQDIANALWATIRASQEFDGITTSVQPPPSSYVTYYLGWSAFFQVDVVAPIAA